MTWCQNSRECVTLLKMPPEIKIEKPRRRFTVANNASSDIEEEKVDDGSQLDKKSRRRWSSRFQATKMEENLSQRRPSSPWSAVGRFLERWPSFRKKFRKRSNQRRKSDSAVEVGRKKDVSKDNIGPAEMLQQLEKDLSSQERPQRSDGTMVSQFLSFSAETRRLFRTVVLLDSNLQSLLLV